MLYLRHLFFSRRQGAGMAPGGDAGSLAAPLRAAILLVSLIVLDRRGCHSPVLLECQRF